MSIEKFKGQLVKKCMEEMGYDWTEVLHSITPEEAEPEPMTPEEYAALEVEDVVI